MFVSVGNKSFLFLTLSAGCFFSGEVRAQSAVSDVEPDTQKASTDEAICLVTSASPESVEDASLNLSTDTPKPCIPKVTSDSFISELVSDREPLKSSTDVGAATLAALVESKSPCAGVALSHGTSLDPQWSNVDLEEAHAQQAQSGAIQDSADTCSLSSVATYTLGVEDLYGADEHPLWAWVSGGGCSVDSHSPLNWFNCSVNTCE